MSQPPIPEKLEHDQWTAEDIHTTDQHGHHRYWRIYVQLFDEKEKGKDKESGNAKDKESGNAKEKEKNKKPLHILKQYLDPGAELPAGVYAEINVQTGIIGDNGDGMRTVNATEPTLVREGKNLGRKNATNALTQAIAEARSRYRKHLKSSAPRLREESKTATTAAIASLAKKMEPHAGPSNANTSNANTSNASSSNANVAPSNTNAALSDAGPSHKKGKAKATATSIAADKAADPAIAPGPRPVMLARNLEDKWPPLADFCGDAAGEPCVFVLRKFDGVRAGAFLMDKVDPKAINKAGPNAINKADPNAHKVEPVFFGRRLDLQERRADMYPLLQPYFDTARRLGLNATYGPMILDGEIYHHGWSRQTIIGKEHRQDEQQAAEADLDYYVFLVRFPFTPAGRALTIKQLLELRRRLFEETPPQLSNSSSSSSSSAPRPRIVGAEFFPIMLKDLCDEAGKPLVFNKKETEAAQNRILQILEEYMNRFLREGYEGAVIYRGCQPYEESTESHRKGTLLRLKPVYEEEFEVVGFEADQRGKAEGAIKWVVLTPALKAGQKPPPAADRKAFKTTFKDMTLEDRKRWYKEMQEKDSSGRTTFERLYKGKPLTISFRDYTDDGVPMHAWATGFRDKNEV